MSRSTAIAKHVIQRIGALNQFSKTSKPAIENVISENTALHAIKWHDRKWWTIVRTDSFFALNVHEMTKWLSTFDCGTAFVANFSTVKLHWLLLFKRKKRITSDKASKSKDADDHLTQI